MEMLISPRLVAIFLRVLHARRWIIAVFAILTLAGVYGATRVPTDPSIERLIVPDDPVALATVYFARVFPVG
jgi:predicted RND superfamily exporter protein